MKDRSLKVDNARYCYSYTHTLGGWRETVTHLAQRSQNGEGHKKATLIIELSSEAGVWRPVGSVVV